MADYPKTIEEKRAWLQAGRVIRYPKDRPEDEDEAAWDTTRTIPASMLQQLLKEDSPASVVPIRLRHVIVDGDLELSYATCAAEFSATEESRFTGKVNFSYCKFLGLAEFTDCHFARRALFEFASFAYDLRIAMAVFEDEALFRGIAVGGRIIARGATFGTANFWAASCSKTASFNTYADKDSGKRQATRFNGEALFGETRFDTAHLAERDSRSSAASFFSRSAETPTSTVPRSAW